VSLYGRSENPQTAPRQRSDALVERAQFKEQLRPRFGEGCEEKKGRPDRPNRPYEQDSLLGLLDRLLEHGLTALGVEGKLYRTFY